MKRRLMLAGVFTLASPRLRAGSPRRLSLRHYHTGARFEGPWHDGTAPDPVAMAELSGVLADSAAIRPRPFDAAALGILADVAEAAGLSGPLVVRSGYRTPAINAAVHGAGDSQHLRAGAIDLEVASARIRLVGGLALGMGRGGVGVYPRRGFVHLDSGPVRHWNGDAPGAGMPAPVEDRIGRIAAAWRNPGGRR
ncbi:YcbK family protein [Falsiroseomonas sp.]|uniref:YcbK family protein n=1 Tax=Falsiroseomonas sp. TaxID=2870721 RepID=UPI003F70C1F0